MIKSPLMEQLKSSLTRFVPEEPAYIEAGTVTATTVTTHPVILETTLPTQPVILETTLPAASLPVESQAALQPMQARGTEYPELLATAQTKQSANENRVSNLRLICQALNGKVLQPGEILSFNETVGERNGENGFKAAPGYSGKGTPDMMGGGTNQGASTLYYCAMLADLEILERSSGEYLSSFLDPGMDAMVSWPGPDLKIRNNTGFPIQLLAEADQDFVTMEFRGTSSRDYYVKMEYLMTNVDADTVYQEQQSGGPYPDGYLLQSGHNGAYVRSFRCKYSKQTDQLLSQELEVLSTYPAVSNIIVRITETEPPFETLPETQPPTESLPETQPPTESLPETQPPTESLPETQPPETEAPPIQDEAPASPIPES